MANSGVTSKKVRVRQKKSWFGQEKILVSQSFIYYKDYSTTADTSFNRTICRHSSETYRFGFVLYAIPPWWKVNLSI